MEKRRIWPVTTALKAPTLRRLIAIALMVWCAGAGCIMVSYAQVAMSAADSTAPAAEQTVAAGSAAMGSHACCKARHKALQRTRIARKSANLEANEFTLFPPARGNAMSCCPLASGSIVLASRSQSNETDSALTLTDSSNLNLEKSCAAPVVVPLRLPNRAHSYLLDCAFLI